jgi:putative DNA primase/helicase
MNGARDLPELRDFIRSRRAALFGFMEQGAALELNSDVLKVIPRNDIYVRYLTDNRNVIADLASELYGRPIEVVVEVKKQADTSAATPDACRASQDASEPEPTSSRPARPAEPQWENIPYELTTRPQWVDWRYEWREGKQGKGGKWTKPPFQPDGKPASSTYSSTWSPFEHVQTAYFTNEREPFDGVGFVLSGDDPFVGFDFDHVVDPATGKITDSTIAEYVCRLDSYTEITPSGTGLRTFVRATLPGEHRRAGPVEIYEDGRFLSITGNRLPGTPDTINDRREAVEIVYAEVFAERNVRWKAAAIHSGGFKPVSLDDAALIERARTAKDGAKFSTLYDSGEWQGFASQSEADLCLASKLAFWTGRDAARIDALFRHSALMRPKWDRADYRERTINAAIAGCNEVYQDWQTSSNGSKPELEDSGDANEPPQGNIQSNPPSQSLPFTAEDSILREVLRDNSLLGQVRKILEEKDFGREKSRAIYGALLALAARGEVLAPLTVSAQLAAAGVPEQVAGYSHLVDLVAHPISDDANIEANARLVREASGHREIATIAKTLLNYAQNGVTTGAGAGEGIRRLNDLQQRFLVDGDDPFPDRHPVEAVHAYGELIRLGKQTRYLMKGALAYGASSIWSGLVEAGKSTTVRMGARCFGTGEDFLGRPVQQDNVLVLCSPKEYLGWVDTVGRVWKLQDRIFIKDSETIASKDIWKWIRYHMQLFNAHVLYLDTLADFLGVPPPNSPDYYRSVMTEQTPVIKFAWEWNYHALGTYHQPKSEANNDRPRDPTEAAMGSAGITAQHRMRVSIRRRSRDISTIIMSKGANIDEPIEEETVLNYNKETQLVTLGPPWSTVKAHPSVPQIVDVLTRLGHPATIWKIAQECSSQFDKKTESWTRSGIKAGEKLGEIKLIRKGGSGKNKGALYGLSDWKSQDDQGGFQFKKQGTADEAGGFAAENAPAGGFTAPKENLSQPQPGKDRVGGRSQQKSAPRKVWGDEDSEHDEYGIPKGE